MSATRLTSAAKRAIVIPKRIQRGPTDILKALSGTVIPSQAKYTPFVTDETYLRRRSIKPLALAKISGIKTAKLLLNEHPEIFTRDESEPKVEDFQLPELFSDDMNLDESDLIWSIEHADVKNAITAYNVIKSKDIGIDTHVLQEFFELICYFNEKNPPTGEELAEIHLGQKNISSRPVWHDDGIAEQVFIELREKGDKAKAYNTMILGLSKWGQSSRAYQYFLEMKELQLGACVEVYNILLLTVRNSSESRMEKTSDTSTEGSVDKMSQILIDQMNAEDIAPNRETFNALLKRLTFSENTSNSSQVAVRLLNEMVSSNIKPSLSTYKRVLDCLLTQNRVDQEFVRFLVVKIVDIIESRRRSLVAYQDDQDRHFFPHLMTFLKNKMRDPQLANRVHSCFMVDPSLSSNQPTYYGNLFEISFTADSLENSIQLYEELVPYFYRPSPAVYEVIIDALELFGGHESFRARITDDIRTVDMSKIGNISALIKDYDPSADRSITQNVRKRRN